MQNVYFNVLAGSNLKTRYDLDYWGLANRAALEYILHQPAERQRERVADGGAPARYVISNYHGFKEPDNARHAIIELGACAMILVGLFTRLAALPLIVMMITIQFVVYWNDYPSHLLWFAVLVSR